MLFPKPRRFISSHEKAVIYPAFIFRSYMSLLTESVKIEKKKEVGKILFQEAQGALSWSSSSSFSPPSHHTMIIIQLFHSQKIDGLKKEELEKILPCDVLFWLLTPFMMVMELHYAMGVGMNLLPNATTTACEVWK